MNTLAVFRDTTPPTSAVRHQRAAHTHTQPQHSDHHRRNLGLKKHLISITLCILQFSSLCQKTQFKMFLKFLITPEFYSKVGFLISYVVTSLLVLEVLRLVYTDVNKREVEKMLDSYSKSRSESRQGVRRRIPIDDLDKHPQTPHHRRTSSPAVTPDSERTLINEERRRRRAQSSAAVPVLQTDTPAPARKLRKRSDTLNSAGVAEPKKLERRRREASPASLAGSKASSRNGSPKPLRKVRDKEAQQLSSSLHKLLRQKV